MSAVTERIGKQIREARKAKGLTQKELGEKIGVAETTVTNYESGRQNLTLETVQKIADALQTEIKILPD